MGDYYDVVMLGGKIYISYCSEKSDWKEAAKEITLEQAARVDAMDIKHRVERDSLIKEILNT